MVAAPDYHPSGISRWVTVEHTWVKCLAQWFDGHFTTKVLGVCRSDPILFVSRSASADILHGLFTPGTVYVPNRNVGVDVLLWHLNGNTDAEAEDEE